jgi:hypothetical protein
MARKLLTEADINLLGVKKDARMLQRYVAQVGADALPFLENALANGSATIRQAAISLIGSLDGDRALRIVRAEIAAIRARKPNKKTRQQLNAQYKLLRAIGTPEAVIACLVDGGDLDSHLTNEARAAVFAYVAAEVPAANAAAVRSLIERSAALRTTLSGRLGEPARAAAEALLAHPSGAFRPDAARLLTAAVGPLEACAVLDGFGVTLEVDLAIKLWGSAPADERAAVLARYVRTKDERAEIARILGKDDDGAWLKILEPYIDESPVMFALLKLQHPSALERVLVTAARDEFDIETKTACHLIGQVGETRGAPILLRWLADPAGIDAAPMLLVALSACGDASALPALEQLRDRHPGRGGFFDHAIASIRYRMQPASAEA